MPCPFQAHVVDLHSKTIYAVGAFGQGGYEKIVEINSQHPEYVMFALSGYNGPFRKLKKDATMSEKESGFANQLPRCFLQAGTLPNSMLVMR